jgi:hypothetical protein
MKYIAYLFCSAIFFFGIYYIVPEYLIISAAVWLIVSAASIVYLYFVDLTQQALVDSNSNPNSSALLNNNNNHDNTLNDKKLERCPTTTEDTKLLAKASTLTGHKLPKQAANATITVSTLNGEFEKYTDIREYTLPKATRILNLLKRYPNKDFIFIDDSKSNIIACPSSTKIQSLLYNKDNIYTDLKVSKNTILLLDFDETLTTKHTHHDTRPERNRNIEYYTEYTVNFNQNIINFLKKFPGDVIILTDHNNHDFVVSQIKKAIKQCNSEYNQEQELNRDNKTKSHNHEPLNY